MVKPLYIEEVINQSVEVISQEHNDGSDNPKTVALLETNKKSSWQLQTNPFVKNKLSDDLSIEGQNETVAVDAEGEQRHLFLEGVQVDYIYEGEKLLRGNVSHDFILAENHGPESLKQKQESEIASRYGVKKAPFYIADNIKTSCEYTSKQPPTLLENLKKDNLIEGKHSKMKRKSSENRRFQTKRKMTGCAKILHIFRALGKRWCIWICGLLLVPLLVHGAAASSVTGHEGCVIPNSMYEPGCSLDGSSREDDVLDAFDVQDGLYEGTFDGSSRNYRRVCSNAFHDVHVNTVNLRYNSLQDLPYGVFDHTIGLTRLYLNENKFTDFPRALNSLTDLQLLDISNNRISVIPKGSMNGLKSLTSLYLSGNQDMEQVPEGLLDLMNNPSLKSVFLTNTKIQHPLVPAPHLMVCTTDNPCNVTHRVGGVVVTPMIGNSVTFEITQNGALTCKELKEQLEADYEILNGSISCKNNILGGSVKIARKSKSGTETDVTNEPTGYVPTTENDKKGNMVSKWVFVGVGIIVAICVLVIIVVVCKKLRKPNVNPTEGNARPNNASDSTTLPPTPHNGIPLQETGF